MTNLIRFQSYDLPYVKVEDQIFIPIRPICQALGLDPKWHTESIKNDEDLSLVSGVHSIPDSRGHLQKMVCLPERYIYGWLFGIKKTNTMSEETKENLREYRLECYDVMYSYFHGKLIKRKNKLQERVAKTDKIHTLRLKLESELKESPTYKEIIQIETDIKGINKVLKQLDIDIAGEQLSLFNEEAAPTD